MTFISHFGDAISVVSIAVAAIILLRNKKDAICIAVNLSSVTLVNYILKEIIKRPRPNILRLIPETGYSFPSAHAMVSMGFYGFLIYLIYKKVNNKIIRYFSMILLSLLILFIGISRIYLGVHYATDVIGGFIIGLIFLVLFLRYVYNNKRWKREV